MSSISTDTYINFKANIPDFEAKEKLRNNMMLIPYRKWRRKNFLLHYFRRKEDHAGTDNL